MKLRLIPALALALGLLPCASEANVVLAPLFQDNAVLQQGKPVPVWGTADPNEKVTVEFGGQKKATTADGTGHWSVDLDALPASARPAELVVTAGNTLRVGNILVGEVWICSGQSNMAFTVLRALDFQKEAAAATDPLIRHFKVQLKSADSPAETANGSWAVCGPGTVRDFTAAGYFFARELRKTLGVPVGLVNASYGGTPVESWMSDAALKSDPAFAVVFDRWKRLLATYPEAEKAYEPKFAKWTAGREAAGAAGTAYTVRPPRKPDGPGSRMTPSGLFNAMVHPLIPYAARGILWYQGEANAGRASEYGALFTAMITQWRRDFGQGDLPFYFVQLANLERKSDTSGQQWAFQREAQASALKLPNTGMAVAADIGDATNIHPKNKQEVGRRLALIALALTYEKGGEYAGPVFKAAEPDGGSMRATFTHGAALKLSADPAGGFELAGADKVFHPATARVDGGALVVTSPDVAKPVAIRYGWSNDPSLSLRNDAGLPAPPFRSDHWAAPVASRAEAPAEAASDITN